MTSPLADTTSLKRIRFILLSKCNSKEVYSLQVSLNDSKTTSQTYFEKLFQNKEIIYLMQRWVTIENNLHIFQYKIMNEI